MIQWQSPADDERLLQLKHPKPLSKISPDEACQLACDVALQGVGYVSPNPPVGAVAVNKDHLFLGLGFHRLCGGPHAEVELVDSLKSEGLYSKLEGGTIYVTLEPCCFHGKTPACTDLLKTLPIKKVVFGALDQNPKVSGKGIEILKAKGIACEAFMDTNRANALIEIFSWNQTKAKPFVALKTAATLDGSIGVENKGNFAITGARAKEYGHYLRLKYDGIIVGSKTLASDNPSLSCRLQTQRARDPKRFVLDPTLEGIKSQPIEKLNLVNKNPELTYFVIAQKFAEDAAVKQLRDKGCQIITQKVNSSGHFILDELLAKFFEMQIYSVLLEGGAGLYGSFLEANLVNKLHLFQTPRIIGGSERIHWGNAINAKSSWTCKNMSLTPLGEDWVIEANL